MSARFARTALAASLALFVAACGDKPAETAVPAAATANANTPDATIRRSVDLLKQGDIAGMLKNAMPPAAYEKVRSDWAKEKEDKPITDEDRQKFAETMQKLTAPGAEDALFAEIEPQLTAFDAQYQQQAPMYIAMGTSYLQSAVQQNKDLSDAEKQQATTAVNALGAWAQKTRFTDPASVKKVIAIVTRVARDSNVKSLDEVRGLDFDHAMQKMGPVVLGLKQALDVYGFSVDKTLDSVKPEIVSNDGKTAKVKVSYTLFDAPLTTETEMVNVDGRWYGKDAIEKFNQSAAEGAAPAESAPKEG